MGIIKAPLQNQIQKQLASTLSAGATSMTLNEDVSALFSGVSSDNPGVCVVDRIDSNGTATPSKREYIKFTGVSGAALTGLTRNADSSGTDQEHSVGAIVEFVSDVLFAKSILDTFDVEHNADGTHDTTKVVTLTGTQTLTNKTLTSPKINEDVALTVTSTELNLLDGVTALPTKASASDIVTGTDDTKFATPKAIKDAGISVYKSVVIQVVDGAVSTSTGDGKAYFTIPEELNGMNLVGVHARVVTAGTTNTTNIQIANVTDSVDMLSTKLTIDSGETGSDTAATPAVINTSYDDVATNDLIRIDVDAVSSTPAKGLIVRLRFALP